MRPRNDEDPAGLEDGFKFPEYSSLRGPDLSGPKQTKTSVKRKLDRTRQFENWSIELLQYKCALVLSVRYSALGLMLLINGKLFVPQGQLVGRKIELVRSVPKKRMVHSW